MWGHMWGQDSEERGILRKINIIGIFLYKDANGILTWLCALVSVYD